MYIFLIHRQAVRITVVLLASVGAHILRAQPQVPVPEDYLPALQDIIETAMQQSPQMLMHYAESDAEDGDLIAGKSGRLPSLRAWGQFVRSREQRNDNAGVVQTDNKGNYDLRISQPVFYWGAISRDVRNAKLLHDLAEGRYRRAYLGVVHEIRGTYLLLIIRKQQMALAQMRLDEAEERLERTRRQLTSAGASEADVINAEFHRDEELIDWEEAVASLEQYRSSLARLTGTDVLTYEEIPDTYPELDVESDATILASYAAKFLAQEMPDNEAMRAVIKRLEISQNRLQNTKVRLRPTFDAIAGFSQDEYIVGSVVSEIRTRQSSYVGISGSWAIFDGFDRKGDLLAASHRYEAAKIDMQLNRDAIFDRVRKFGRDLKIMAMAVDLADRRFESARSEYGYIREQASRGDASARRVRNAEEALLDRQIDAQRARQDYWAEVSSFLGYVEEDPAMDRIPLTW